MKKKRLNNIELLRIVAMLMIVTLHTLGHGGILRGEKTINEAHYIWWTVEGLAYVAVNCYVLIMGYFQFESTFKTKKLFILLGEVFFYSVTIYFILCITKVVNFSMLNFIKVITPTLSGEYWFVSIYVGLYILSPFVNSALKRMEKLEHLMLIIVLIILFSIIPNIVFYSDWLNFGKGRGIVWFLVLYCIAAYIRKYYVSSKKRGKIFTAYIFFALLVPVSKFMLEILTKRLFENDRGSGLFYSYNSILVLIASVLLFVLFLNLEIKNPKLNNLITFLAPSTFGVYLIHDNNYIRVWIWSTLKLYNYVDRWFFPVLFVIIVFVIYFQCTFIDKIREKIFTRVNTSNMLVRSCSKLENFTFTLVKRISDIV